MKEQDNFYRDQDKWDYIGYVTIVVVLCLLIFGAMV